MIHVEFNIQRRHLIILAGILAAALLLSPGISWASNKFTDVPGSDWAHGDITWLKDNGLTNGCEDGSIYCPDDNVTRRELAAFMHRLSGGDNRTIDGRLDTLETDNAALKALLAGVTRNGDTLLLTGMNLQVVNGAGTTATTNSLGNVIIGYNAETSDTRTGSHMLVIGDGQTYTSYGGIVAGFNNNTASPYATITGGGYNIASGWYSSVSGGYVGAADGTYSSVSGGTGNTASATYSSVSGGDTSTASGLSSSVSGGNGNTASGLSSSVSGGDSNTASGDYSSVLGGRINNASGFYSSVLGGFTNTAGAAYSTIGGGDFETCTSIQIVFCAEGSVTGAD